MFVLLMMMLLLVIFSLLGCLKKIKADYISLSDLNKRKETEASRDVGSQHYVCDRPTC